MTNNQMLTGILYDFCGFLTTREESLTVSEKHNVMPLVDLIKEFGKLRGLDISGDAAVLEWQTAL
jgi:hypothetical protein